MGNPLSSILANIFMHEINSKIHDNTPFAIKFWTRYVDDVLTALHKDHIIPFLNYINTLHPHIKFTHEVEVDGRIPFLDINIQRVNDSIETSVFRKPIASNTFVN